MIAVSRLKQIGLAGVAALAGVSPAWAALAPNYQRLAELQAILDTPAVVDIFTVTRPIERIEFVGPDLYSVSSGACTVEVTIVDKPGETPPGPRQFTVEIASKSCPD